MPKPYAMHLRKHTLVTFMDAACGAEGKRTLLTGTTLPQDVTCKRCMRTHAWTAEHDYIRNQHITVILGSVP